MSDAHRRVGGIHALPTRTARAIHVDVEVAFVDGHIDFIGLGQHQHRCRRGVNTTLALGDRHPLYAVWPTFELEVTPGGIAAHHERDLVEPTEAAGIARQHLELPPLDGRV